MATYYSQASDNWSNLTNWDTIESGGGSNPASVADMDDDTFIINAGHTITLDCNMSDFTNGIAGLTIRGGATPGMLRPKYDSDGTYHLKIKTGTNIVGTTDTNKGRLLANSDGVWGNSGSLPFGRKFIIDLQGTAKIDAEHLDIALYDTEPENKYVRTCGTKYSFVDEDVDTTNNTINIDQGGSETISNGTPVMVTSSGDVPGGLAENILYYVRQASGSTIKLATVNDDTAIVDITSVGNGTRYVYRGQASGTNTVGVLDDVTSDSLWTTVEGHNHVVLVDAKAPQSYDQQRVQLTTINANNIVLSANVDSDQFPGGWIVLVSRNVSIRSAGTSSDQAIVDYNNAQSASGVFQCEIRNTAGSGTTFYGRGINSGTGHTISGLISGCNYGIRYGTGHTISGLISGCSNGINSGTGHTISGLISGCNYGINSGAGHTISGSVSGCSNGINSGAGHTISGSVSGCSNGIYSGTGHTISGSVSGCSNGIYSGTGHTISGLISGCNYGIRYGTGHLTGAVKNNTHDFSFSDYNIFTLQNVEFSAGGLSIYSRNSAFVLGRISCEDHAQITGAHKIYDNMGDIIKTACDGTGDAPSVDPDGGHDYCVELSNIQSNCDSDNPLLAFKHRIWATASVSKTYTYKIQTTYANLAIDDLVLTGTYLDESSGGHRATIIDNSAINQRTDNTDWSQALAVTINPTQTGWVDLKIELKKYESLNEVYIWPAVEIS